MRGSSLGGPGREPPTPAVTPGRALRGLDRREARLFAVPTAGRVTDHPFALFFRATLAAVAPDSNPAYIYQLAFLERGRIPPGTTYRVRNRDLATVDARY